MIPADPETKLRRKATAEACPCNAQRLARRRAAHDEGAWVREAALAHAAKQQDQNHENQSSERSRLTVGGAR